MTIISRERGRIFVVDDHEAMRALLVSYIAREEDLEICGMASSGEEALEEIQPLDCDLALIDVSMPGMNGLELTHHLRVRHPKLKCLMLSGHAEHVYVQGALKAGAQGYVMKGDPDAIFIAIRKVLRGEVYLSEEVQGYWR